jgi:hypothetical protein
VNPEAAYERLCGLTSDPTPQNCSSAARRCSKMRYHLAIKTPDREADAPAGRDRPPFANCFVMP